MNVFDQIGYYGPILLLITTICLIWSRTSLLLFYMLFFMINYCINGSLKLIIREPRPDGNIVFNSHEITTGSERYGMPSGHAQSVAFSSMFSYLITKSTKILMGTSFISAITIYQRYKYKRHTIGQLFVGTLIGGLMAVLCHKIYTSNV
jgi:membrane-associated phospholipid phosphatase